MQRIDSDIESEMHDVFQVVQITRDTPIEEQVGADLVTMSPNLESEPHRHNHSETVLFFYEGEATVFINGDPHAVKAGHRILIHAKEFHAVATPEKCGCKFLSVQTPPILSKATGFRDLETLEDARAEK